MKIASPVPRRIARIEIIPLIDIVFFLLATFVMVSLSMVKNQGIGVHLPQASTGTHQTATKGELTVISITENGEVYLNKQKVSNSELKQRLKELKGREEDPAILLNGDDKAFLGRAVFVLDEARKLGIKKFAVGTKQV